MSNEPLQKWKIDVNDRYQKVMGTLIALSTASLVLPMVFLREFVAVPREKALVGFLDFRVYFSWAFLAICLITSVTFYYVSAKWVKSAWGQSVAISSACLEALLDWSFWLSVATFILGLASFLWFIAMSPHVS